MTAEHDGEIRGERVNVRMTKGDRALLKAYVVRDAATLAPHGVKVSESSVLIACLRARQIRESGLDSPEKIAAFNASPPAVSHVDRTNLARAGEHTDPLDVRCPICEMGRGFPCEGVRQPKPKRGAKGSGS